VKHWFRSQPIHRKLVITSMAKTTVVLFVAMVALLALDSYRFMNAARGDVSTLAEMVAGNIRASLAFGYQAQTQESLDILHVRPQVQRGCAYDAKGTLVAQFTRLDPCPPAPPGPAEGLTLSATMPVRQAGGVIGYVYVDRDWAALRDRLMTAGLASLVVLALAAIVMLMVSSRLHRNISQPISELASAASQMGQDNGFRMPVIKASEDEVGQLVTAFGAMADRVRSINDDLSRTNDALRREIEDRRKIEEEREALLAREREANRIKDEFLATVSHELRTPLNAIVGWSQILVSAKPPDSATVAKAAASLHRNAQAQARVIDDLIDISRIVTGKLRVVSEPLDLRGVVDAAVDAIRPSADVAGVTIIVSMPEKACVVRGDRDRLQQVVWNLLSNAVKFAPKGVVRVTVSQEVDQLRLTVSDTGVGIPPEFQAHVFDRFRQADSSITREHGGLGIGLAVVKELVELHGGAIHVNSRGRGTGATFSILLPCVDALLPHAAPEEKVPSLAGVSVLAVDDNVDSLDVLRAILAEAGADAAVAASGAEALAFWRERPPDVVLCDLAMPGMSGFQLLAQIRELDRTAGRVTPAIAVTAHASEEQVARSAQAGFQHHVAKPFNSSQLVRAIYAARMRV
jgi:signal transduction histidine kinase/ActR/RegA family two-component response regulator